MTRNKQARQPAGVVAFALILALMIALPAPIEGQPQPTIIRAGVVIDGTGSAPRKNVVIVVQDGRIVDVRDAGQADVANP